MCDSRRLFQRLRHKKTVIGHRDLEHKGLPWLNVLATKLPRHFHTDRFALRDHHEHTPLCGPAKLILDLAHQPDEWVGIEDMVQSAQVMALALAELLGTPEND